MSGLLGGITSPAPACCSCSGRAPAGLALRPVAGRRAAPRPAAACASRRAPRVTRGPRRAAAYDEEGEEAEKWYEEPPEVPYVPQWPNPQYMEVRAALRRRGFVRRLLRHGARPRAYHWGTRTPQPLCGRPARRPAAAAPSLARAPPRNTLF